jgi:hypothetical protein
MISISQVFYELTNDIIHKVIDDNNKNSMFLNNNKFKAKSYITDPTKI